MCRRAGQFVRQLGCRFFGVVCVLYCIMREKENGAGEPRATVLPESGVNPIHQGGRLSFEAGTGRPRETPHKFVALSLAVCTHALLLVAVRLRVTCARVSHMWVVGVDFLLVFLG